MRNTKEWYFFIDRLVRNGKRLYFYLDRKFYSPDDALITGIKAILAEDFSRSLSRNINHAHRKRQETGSNIVITSNTWGYDKIHKQTVINEKESGMIRFIYEMAAQDYGSRRIAKMLQDRGYCNHNGGRIAEQTVRRIIRNPLYKGTAVMNVLHKDFETKRTERNSRDKWICHDHLVPAIVSEELWKKANDLMDQRSVSFITEDFKKKIIGSRNNSYSLTGKIICGLCGNTYWRRTSVSAKGKTVYWDCREYVQRGRKTKNNKISKEAAWPDAGDSSGCDHIHIRKEAVWPDVSSSGCDNVHIREKDLDDLIYEIAGKLCQKSDEAVLSAASAVLKQAVCGTSEYGAGEDFLKGELEKLKTNRSTLLDRYLDDKIADDIYHMKDERMKKRMDEIEQEIRRLHDKNVFSGQKGRVMELEHELKKTAGRDLRIHDLKKHIEKILVCPDSLTFSFDDFGGVRAEIHKINNRKTEYHICL